MSNEVISEGIKPEGGKELCEFCGEAEAIFSIEVTSPDGEITESDLVCPSCISTWFTETPEDVERMSIVRLEGKE